MTSNTQRYQEFLEDKRHHEQQEKQAEIDSKRNFAANIIGSGISALGRIVPAGIARPVANQTITDRTYGSGVNTVKERRITNE